MSGWRWLFIIQGVISFGLAIVGAFLLPDEPLNTRWLTLEERELAHRRIAAETVHLQEGTTTWKGLIDACKDYKLWLFIIQGHVSMASTNFKNFFPTIVSTLGYNRTITLALTCPPYLVAGVVSVIWAWNSGKLITPCFLGEHYWNCSLTGHSRQVE